MNKEQLADAIHEALELQGVYLSTEQVVGAAEYMLSWIRGMMHCVIADSLGDDGG